MDDRISHVEELTYKIEETVENALKFGVNEDFLEKIYSLTSRLRMVLRNNKSIAKLYKEALFQI